MRLLIAGGGTGGHIYPALAVVDALRRRANPPDIGWLGGHRGLESERLQRSILDVEVTLIDRIVLVDDRPGNLGVGGYERVDRPGGRPLGELAHTEDLELDRLELLVKVESRHQPNLPVT